MALTAKQIKLCELLVNAPKMSNPDLAKECEIGERTIYRWKHNDEVIAYVHMLCQKKFAGLEKIAMQKLAEQLEKENWKAIEYVLNGHDYKPSDKIDANVNASVVFEGEDKIED